MRFAKACVLLRSKFRIAIFFLLNPHFFWGDSNCLMKFYTEE